MTDDEQTSGEVPLQPAEPLSGRSGAADDSEPRQPPVPSEAELDVRQQAAEAEAEGQDAVSRGAGTETPGDRTGGAA